MPFSRNYSVIFLLFLGATSFFSTAVAQTTVSFDAPPRDHALPSTPNVGVAGVFNGDGFEDFASIGDVEISVLPGKGNGKFSQPISTVVQDLGYLAVVAGDFNGDGILDLAATSQLPSGIIIFLGGGNGRFVPQPVIPIGANSSGLVAADLNHDGHLDLAIATNTTVTVLLGTGSGTFLPALTTRVAESAVRLQVGDFNGDGNLDVATNAQILLGNGDGTFHIGSTYSPNGTMGSFAVGDVNGDGKLDIVGVVTQGETAVLLGNGNGTFQAPTKVAGVNLGNKYLDSPSLQC